MLQAVTVDTAAQQRVVSLPGGFNAANAGYGRKWRGFETKAHALLEWLEHADPKRLALFVDADVVYGGCGEHELLRRYNLTVGASASASACKNQYS